MIIKPIKTRVFQEGDDLVAFITDYFKKLSEKSVVVITSKIVALAEKRTALAGSKKAKEALIRKESDWAIQTKYTWLTVKDGMVMAAAGIDESNADGKCILLPKDSYGSAEKIRTALRRIFKVRDLAVLITDSRIMPLRAGITAVATGYAGFSGIRDYRGSPDIFGRIMKISRTNIADSLATAAVIEMGEGSEQRPLALITGASNIEFRNNIDRHEVEIDITDDMYAPFFKSARFKKKYKKNN